MHHADPDLRRIASVAHECWCAQMRAEGWSYGPAYDADRKQHDALVSFDELHEREQRNAILCIRSERLSSQLAEAMDYPRGPDRPFLLDDLWEGRRVAALEHEARLGVITGWDIENDELSLIYVRWDDGQVGEFDPWLQALVRPEEAPGRSDT